MKVSLVFTRYRPPRFRGGIERYVDEVGKKLIERSSDCDVVALDEPLPAEGQVPARYVRVLRGIPFAPVLSFAVRTRGYWRDYDRVLVQYAQLGLSVPTDRLYCVVHSTCLGESKSLSGVEKGPMAALKSFGLRTVGAGLEWTTFRRARAIVAINDHIRDELVHGYGVPPEKISIIGNAVDCRAFSPDPNRKPRTQRGLDLLYVGRLVPRKNVPVLLRALALCDPAIRCTIAGDGPDREALQRLAAELGLDARVTFQGFLASDALKAAYRAADALVMPSTYEGMPMVILEAKGCGLPTVAANFSGAPALLPEHTGMVVDPPEPQQFARAFEALLADPSRLAAMAQGARRDALERFDWDKIADQLIAKLDLQ